MSITAKELAKILNLSEAAISMALNNKPGVSTQTRKKVIETARAKGYDFSKIAVSEPQFEDKGTIFFVIFRKHGAVVTSANESHGVNDVPFFAQLSEGVASGCKQCHYHLNVTYLYEDDDLEETINSWKLMDIKGILLLGTEMDAYDLKPFLKAQIPIVVLDNYFETINVDCVLINNVQGAFLATEYLIKKRRSQPGYLHSSYDITGFDERSDGFYKAIRKNGMSTSRSIVHRLTPSVEGACSDMLELLRDNEPLAKCYFADNDQIAAGAIKAFQEMGYKIPEDISVIGFDDMPLCTYINPPLTTVHVPKQYMGELAVKRLAEITNASNASPVKIEIDTTIAKRGSV